MGDVAIHVDGLGKRYRLGQREQYKTLRDAIADAAAAAVGRSRRHRESAEERHVWALRDVSLEIEPGQAVGLIGRNGAGKTTLLKILSRITWPTTGRAEIAGRVGSLLEVGTGFHPELTGRENVYLNGAILGMRKREIDRKFDEIVAFAGVERFLKTPVKRYSSGMYVRLAFAVAAHLEPEVLLVDEVLAVGDAEFQKRCLGKIRDVAGEGRTVVFVSHNLPVVQRLCTRAFLLDGGRVAAEGATEKVLDAYYALMTDGSQAAGEREIPDGAVGLVSWSVGGRESTDLAHAARSGEDCTIEFRLVAKRSLAAGQFSLTILDAVGNFIVGIRRGTELHECVPLEPGVYRVRFSVPELPLRPGHYTLVASAGDLREGTLDEWHAQPRLRVLPRYDAPADAWGGILDLIGAVDVASVEVPLAREAV